MVSGEERTSSKCKTLGQANVEDASQTEATWKTQKKHLFVSALPPADQELYKRSSQHCPKA